MNLLGVFGKYWEPGKVKTRLASTIGIEKAASLYFDFLKTTLVRSGQFWSQKKSLIYCPANQVSEFQNLVLHFSDSEDRGSTWEIEPQVEGDLGQRMEAFFEYGIESGAQKVLLMGSDCPHFGEKVLSDALEKLEENDLVFGPAEDGGYYLIGSRIFCPEVFRGIEWSTESVLEQSMAEARKAGRSVGLVENQFDLDDYNSLIRFSKQFESNSCEHLNSLAKKIEKIL